MGHTTDVYDLDHTILSPKDNLIPLAPALLKSQLINLAQTNALPHPAFLILGDSHDIKNVQKYSPLFFPTLINDDSTAFISSPISYIIPLKVITS